jgi:hypothetical protein
MEPKNRSGVSGMANVGLIFLAVGLVAGLLVGWVLFPAVLYSQKSQPVEFPHLSHMDSGCEYCHYFRDDGTYSGAPGVFNCMECHMEPMLGTEAEMKLVEEYVQPAKPIDWLVYAEQPDNVYFSHASHLGEDMECTTCHREVADEMELPVYKENRLTGYSKQTMPMDECEKCHAEQGVSNACGTCHK